MTNRSRPAKEFLKGLESLQAKHDYSSEELQALMSTYFAKQQLVPLSIFTSALGPYETIVKYLKENLGMRFSQIARLTGRDQRAVGASYRKANAKLPGPLLSAPTQYSFPAKILSDRRLSVSEHIVSYLRKAGLSYREIGQLMARNERTVWTIAKRAEKKQA